MGLPSCVHRDWLAVRLSNKRTVPCITDFVMKNKKTILPLRPAVSPGGVNAFMRLSAGVALLGLLAIGNHAAAADRYVRPTATGAANGTDWNNAWAVNTINWSSINAGDTIWLAGGTHTGIMRPTKGGSAGNFVYVKRVRATDSAPVAAAGWNSAFDSQVIIATGGTALYFDTPGISYLYFDGRVDMGLQLVCGNSSGNQASCNITRAANNLTFTNIDFTGPGSSASGVSVGNNPVDMNGDHVGIRSFPYNSSTSTFEYVDNLYVSHCRVRGHPNEFWWHHTRDSVVEYCKIYDNGARNSATYHGNMFINAGTRNITFRYNEIFNWQVEGIFYIFDSCSYWYIYGNVFHDGMGGPSGNTHRVLEPQSNQHGPIFFYNNTVVNCWGDIRPANSGGTWSSDSVSRNNIFYNISSGYNGGGINAANNITGGSNPFVNYAGQDYHIVATTGAGYPRNSGVALAAVSGHTLNLDAEGKTRGADGSWDIGALEYGAAVASTNPVISVTPSSQDMGSIQSGTTIDRTFTIQNVGAGTLTGTVTVASPFSIVSGGTYSLGSNQSQTVTIRYSPTAAGNHSQTITFTGGGGASVVVTGAAWVVQSGSTFNAIAGAITAPFTTTGGFVSQTADTGVTDGGLAVYGFTVPSAGNYKITVNVNAPDDGANSIFVNVDAEPADPSMIWDIPVTSGFQDRTVAWRGNGTFDANEFSPKLFALTAGTHKLMIRGRERGVQLNQISIKKPLVPPPNLTVK